MLSPNLSTYVSVLLPFQSRYPSAPALPLSPIVSWNPTSPIFLEKFSVHIVPRKAIF